MTEKQKTAYDWAKAHPDYRSIAAGHARELAGLVDELMEALTKANQSGCPYDITRWMDAKRMTNEQAARILDPMTSWKALAPYAQDGQMRLAVTEEAC